MSSLNFCFTLNNYTEENINFINTIDCKYIIYGKETGENNTPHLQGFIVLHKRLAVSKVLKILPNECHVEICKGSAKQNITYYKKQNEFVERGTAPVRGKRNNLTEMVNAKLLKTNPIEMFETFGDNFVKYYKSIKTTVDIINHEKQLKKLKTSYTSDSLRPWQLDLVKILDSQNDRQITWIYDKDGNSGKTYFAKYLVANKDCIYFNNSKNADIFYAYEGEDYICYDFCRYLLLYLL